MLHRDGGGWGTLTDIEDDQILRVRGSGWIDFERFLLKLGNAQTTMEAQKSGTTWEENSEKPE